MEGDHKRDAVKFMDLSTQTAQGPECVEKGLPGDAAQGQNDTRPDQFDLAYQIRKAQDHLLRKRIAVSGRAAF